MLESILEENVRFDVAGCSVEGVLSYPDAGRPADAWLLLAPHPQMGGRMTNNVIQTLACKAAESGRAALRFNYRGVGESEIELPENLGVFDYWAALERDRQYGLLIPDVQAAHPFLAHAAPGAAIVVVGYSLGAILAPMASSNLQPSAIVAIAPPVRRVSLDSYASCEIPKIFVTGDDDFAFFRDVFLKQYEKLPAPKTHIEIPGADHFFRGSEERLACAVLEALNKLDGENVLAQK